ncbi:MAG: hypothetical protein HYY16_17200 [Planctomycetes bacterium]|nr:hypothetical protein [Planctomycetota bacterium]
MALKAEREVYAEVRFPFKFIFYREDDRWVGHCLETDTVVEGKSPADAVRNLKDALELQITDALAKKNLSTIYNPAPREYWQMLPQAIEMVHVRRFEDVKTLLDQLGEKLVKMIHSRREGGAKNQVS